MLRMFMKIAAIAAVMMLSFTLYGQQTGQLPSQQSLGDIAREYREKQATENADGAGPKVFTNKDLPANPNKSEGASAESEPAQQPSRPAAIARDGNSNGNNEDPFAHRFANQQFPNQRYGDQRYANQNFANQHATEQWRQRIQMQESRVANLQARIDQMTAMAHSQGGTAQYEGPYNRYQARQMERISQMQQMLYEQKQQLAQMQDEARRAGMHTSVYDP
jgi:hypothetical protein